MVEDISPRDSLEHALRYWWVISLAMVIGGLLGWGISRFLPPVFEARASYRVTLDDNAVLAEANKTNPDAELTYEIRAPYLTPISLMFYTPEVRTALERQAQSRGIDFPQDGFRSGQLTLDNRRSDWMVIVRHRDGELAAKLANLWVAIADEYLKSAHEQAVLAESLKLQMSLVAKCFQDSSLTEANQCAGTSFTSLDEMQVEYQGLNRKYQDALSASQGISALASFEPGVIAEPPLRPVYYNTGWLLLAGSLLGLIVGGVIVQKMPLK